LPPLDRRAGSEGHEITWHASCVHADLLSRAQNIAFVLDLARLFSFLDPIICWLKDQDYTTSINRFLHRVHSDDARHLQRRIAPGSKRASLRPEPLLQPRWQCRLRIHAMSQLELLLQEICRRDLRNKWNVYGRQQFSQWVACTGERSILQPNRVISIARLHQQKLRWL
jgi:hypothetical protein